MILKQLHNNPALLISFHPTLPAAATKINGNFGLNSYPSRKSLELFLAVFEDIPSSPPNNAHSFE
jgi:hypothetical protein